MAKQKKNSYRLRFSIGDKRPEYIAHTQAEAASVQLNVNKLISSQKTGVQNIEALEWAQTRPKGRLKDFLIRWGLLEDTSDREKTIADLRKEFMGRSQKERTLLNYRNTFDSLCEYFGEQTRIRDIDKVKAGEFIKYLKQHGNKQTGGKLSDNSVATHVKSINTFFNWAVDVELIARNPFKGFDAKIKPNRERLEYITKEDTIKVIERTLNKEHRVIIALWRFCGIRGASELSRLTFDASCLHLSTDKKPGEILVHSTKVEHHTGHEKRPIPLTPYVEQLILDLWEAAPEGENKFFPKMTASSNPGKIVKDEFNAAGVELKKPYNLRDSYVTDLMAEGMHEKDPKMFEMLAGHDIKTSLTYYQILTNERKERATSTFLRIMDVKPEGKTTPQFCPQLPPKNAPSSFSDSLADTSKNENLSLENIDLSLENTGYYKKTKNPCEMLQGNREKGKIPEVGIEPTRP